MDILNAFSHQLGIVIGQRLVGSKTNEIPEIIRLLEELTLTGRLVTLEALHAQRDTAQAIVKKEGANSPRLYADLELLFKRPPGPPQDLRLVEQPSTAHGRLETRRLGASTDVKGYSDWPGVEQGLWLERQVLHLATGEITTAQVYGLTRLPPDQLDLAHVRCRWRGHWSIDNRRYWVKDAVLKEHASRVRTGQAPFIGATLRNMVVSCLRAVGFDSITNGRRHFAPYFDEAIAFMCGALE